MSVYGHVDGINGKLVSGWLVDRDSPERRCVVCAQCGDDVVAEARADLFREDLKENGVGDGRYAFEITIPERCIGRGPIHLMEKETGVALIGSPVTVLSVPQPSRLADIDPDFADLVDAAAVHRVPEVVMPVGPQERHHDRIARLISEKSAADVLVQELAQLAERVDAQDREIRQLRALVALQNAALSAPEQATMDLPEKADLRADTFVSDVKGFYGLEWSAEGDPFRWTGPERAALLDIYAARAQPTTLSLVLLKMRADGRDDQCRILVDGLPVPVQVQVRGAYVLYRATLPATERRQKTQVCILSPELFSPAADDPASGDTRRLGVAFHRLVMNIAGASRARKGEEAVNA